MRQQLEELRSTRQAASDLAETIKTLEAPLKHQIEALTAGARAALRVLLEKEEQQAAEATEQYLAAAKARAAAIAADPDNPPAVIDLPPGCNVKWISGVEITDQNALPRSVLAPVPKLVKEALSAGEVPGAVLKQHPIFEFRKDKTKAKDE